jgi:hypothetical protein
MHQTITIVTLPKKLLFKIPQNNYILRKKKALNNGGCCYRHNYKICPSTQSVPYIDIWLLCFYSLHYDAENIILK